jgi:formylglycine-generating enzyme required for sulfatase activity
MHLFDVRVSAGTGSHRVCRGGSWINDAQNCACAIRNRNHPGNRDNNLGFRLASSLLRQKFIVYG